MNPNVHITLLLLAFLLSGCAGIHFPENVERSGPLPKIVGLDDEKYFVDEKGQRFFPWGLNYTNAVDIGLIDDNLYSEEAWSIIDKDFSEMKGYSANAVRVHLQYHRFMLDPDTPDHKAFDALDRLLNIAEKHGLYLMVTGLGAYRKADSPEWYDQLSTEERWETQALFWRTVAAEIGHSGAVFAYDLMNEPIVSACPDDGSPCSWIPGNSFGGFHYVQNISNDMPRHPIETMNDWKNLLHAAIRVEDETTLVTVGHMPFAKFDEYSDNLEFQSIHAYPESGHLEEKIQQVKAAVTERPLVISEIFNLRCSREELEEFLGAVRGDYQGLFGHYNGKTLRELSASNTISASMWGDFLELFVSLNPNESGTLTAQH